MIQARKKQMENKKTLSFTLFYSFFVLLADEKALNLKTPGIQPITCYFAYEGPTFSVTNPTLSLSFPVEIIPVKSHPSL